MEGSGKCIFCLQDAEPTSEWEITWFIHCAESLQKLLDLEPFTSSFFEAAEYCRKCKSITRDVDFMSRSVFALERRLSQFRQDIAGMLLDNFDGWTSTSTDKVAYHDNQDEELVLDSPIKYDADDVKPESKSSSTSNKSPQNFQLPETSVGEHIPCCGSTSADESDEGQFIEIEDNAVGNSGELKFICHFPGCNKRFLKNHLLDSHEPTHIGWESVNYSATSTAAFARRQHSATDATNDDNGTPRGLNVSDTRTFPKQLPDSTEKSVVVENHDTISSARRSLRLASKQSKRPIQSETDEASDGGSDFCSPGAKMRKNKRPFQSETDEGSDGGSDFSSSGAKMRKNESFLKSNKLEQPHKDPRVLMTGLIQRLASFFSKNCAVVFREIGESTTSIGEFLSWETIIEPIGSSSLPEETFEATFCFLFEKMLEELEKDRPFGCSMYDCHRRFNSSTVWEHHVIAAHGHILDSFQCFICDKKVPSGARLDTHISKVHGGETHPFECPVPLCSSKYKYKGKLNHHMTMLHPGFDYDEEKGDRVFALRGNKERTGVKMLRCEKRACVYKTKNPKFMRAHLIKSHAQNEGSIPYECDTCGLGFKQMRQYNYHRRFAHQDQKPTCEFCGKLFSRKMELNGHIRSKHLDVATKFSCKLCTRIYFSASDCDAHENLHSKVPPFYCVLSCGPEKRKCGSLGELVKHVQGFHDDVKKAVCHVCGYEATGSAANTRLKIHMAAHTGEKTNKCRYCSKTFTFRSEQTSHEEIHHQDQVKKEYKCEECQQTFHVYAYYYRHRRNKHGSNPIPPFKRKKVV